MSAVLDPQGLPLRFAIESPLGTGGFGSVFRAYDRERGLRVALKRLNRVDAGALYRFKQEFRALADLHHPNLVRLHELFSADGTWCFTMDLIEGVPFDAYVRRAGQPVSPMFESTQSQTESTQVLNNGAPDFPGAIAPYKTPPVLSTGSGSVTPVFDEDRLRGALRGLVSGVLALHSAGILHRDLKPSNVLVCGDGRVVILDFGLVATGVVDSHQSEDGTTAGTPAYMSPEQACGAPLSAASDFYAVGLMLFEALTGQAAFAGSAADILAARATRPPRDPRMIRSSLPSDLCDLCLDLLARVPDDRPRSPEIAFRLGLTHESASRPVRSGSLEGSFVGRGRELLVLQEALAQVRQGRPTVVHILGPSGIGKTALVRQFFAQALSTGEAVVFEGRCYERESVPYKALDEIVDALGRFLKRLPKLEAAALLPRDGRALLRLFPTLGQIGVFATMAGRDPTSDPHELRRRAFGALRDLFARMTDLRPVVMAIDDVQWGDGDSAALLSALLAAPDPPPILLLLAYRADHAVPNEISQALRHAPPTGSAHHNVNVVVGALSLSDSELLARTLLGADSALAQQAKLVATESGGSPLFVGEIARALATGLRSQQDVSLQDVLSRRVSALPTSARQILGSLACAGGPQEKDVLAVVAGLDPEDLSAALEQLRQEQLVGLNQSSGRSLVEFLHDQVRVSMLALLDPEVLRTYHLRLGTRLEQSSDGDPETVAHHFFAAGDLARGAGHAERAGDRAREALAFENAAALFERALGAAAPSDHSRLREKVADALASCGRAGEAAEAFLVNAQSHTGTEHLDLLYKAANQFLRAGRLKEGLATVRPVLEAAGIKMPRTPRRALASVVLRRTWLKARGLGFSEREEKEIPAEDLRRLDICWALGAGLVGVDQVRSADFQVRHLLLSLAAGEPSRIARALSYESILASLEHHSGIERGAKLAALAAGLADRSPEPNSHAWPRAAAALGAWSQSDFPRCLTLLDEAFVMFRAQRGNTFREMVSLEIWFNLHARFLLGRLEDVALRATALVSEARARGDRYAETTARAYIVPLVWLAVDRPDEARREAEDAIALWGQGGCQHQHWAELRAQCSVDLYKGEGHRAVARIESTRKIMKESLLLRMRTPRVEHRYLEGRGLIEAAWADARSATLLLRVDLLIEELEAERNGLASAFAAALRAGATACRLDIKGARVAFAQAAAAFESLKMPLHAASQRRHGGHLIEGVASRDAIAQADARLASAGVAAPEHFARFLAPRARA